MSHIIKIENKDISYISTIVAVLEAFLETMDKEDGPEMYEEILQAKEFLDKIGLECSINGMINSEKLKSNNRHKELKNEKG